MNVLLESHNIKNLYSGLGQFNYHLVKGLYNLDKDSPKFVLNVRDSAKLEAEFGDFFDNTSYVYELLPMDASKCHKNCSVFYKNY